MKTRQARERDNPKRVYYLSMEFLIGRMLNNNIVNMAAHPLIQRAIRHQGWSLEEILEQEPDAGLGNGGPGAARRVLHRFAGDDAVLGHGLRPAL
ncbi:MAG: hypothetical protein WDO56_26515 [Gammaproteobacteria bacterium]